MQDLQEYGSSDDSESFSEFAPAPADQTLSRKRRAVEGEHSAAELAHAVHRSDPTSALSSRGLSAGEVSLSLTGPRQQALPAPSALLDLPVEALGIFLAL